MHPWSAGNVALGRRRPFGARPIGAFALILAVLLLAACSDGTVTSTDPPTSEQTVEDSSIGERYESEEYGFTIDYPEGWEINESQLQPGIAVLIAASESAADGFAENVNVSQPESVPPGMTAEQYVDAGWKLLKGLLRQAEVLDEGETSVGVHPAFYREFEGELQGERLHWFQVAITEGNRGLFLTYTGGGSDFDAFRADADLIIGSFRLTE
jgi:hypothetical protein